MSAETGHKVFEAPKDINVKIWRYMDFTKFVSFLDTQALFFSRSDLLGDPYEGATSHFNKTIWPIIYKNKLMRELMHKTTSHNKWKRQWTFINCWHMNEVESAAMWKLYAQTNEAVTIQSTYSLLHSLLPKNTYVGIVKYINYQTEWLPEGNALYPYVHKRKSFDHEQELRAVITNSPTKTSTDGKSKSFNYIPNPESGRLIPIDIPALVQNIYVAPTSPRWFRQLVKSVIAKYGLSIPISESTIDLKPTF